MTNPTQFEHYNHYPLCGHCDWAWDIIYQRYPRQVFTAPVVHLQHCPHGGCDPDVWDYINPVTGWPKGWKIGRQSGRPNYRKLPPPPKADNRVYHRRDTNSDRAPWRKTASRLLNKAIERREVIRNTPLAERTDLWEEEEEVKVAVASLDDPDLWD